MNNPNSCSICNKPDGQCRCAEAMIGRASDSSANSDSIKINIGPTITTTGTGPYVESGDSIWVQDTDDIDYENLKQSILRGPWGTPVPDNQPYIEPSPLLPHPITPSPNITGGAGIMFPPRSLPPLIKVKDLYTDKELVSSNEFKAITLTGGEKLLFGEISFIRLPSYYDKYLIPVYSKTHDHHYSINTLTTSNTASFYAEPPPFTFASPIFFRLETFNPETKEESKHFVMVLTLDELMYNAQKDEIQISDVRVFEINNNLELMKYVDSDRMFRKTHKIPLRGKRKKKNGK